MASQDSSSKTNQAEDAPQEQTFKQQLDRAATETRADLQEPKQNPIVEKITEYVPAAAAFLGGGKENPDKLDKPEPSIPPHRPVHDDKIEDFVRDQHRSKGGDGLLSEE
ncbi:hypothetical protein G7046_g7575 [Stylonectria norvegica]|nr:hypothetical protein G7046_g7575 [Stylonectria norvegica]